MLLLRLIVSLRVFKECLTFRFAKNELSQNYFCSTGLPLAPFPTQLSQNLYFSELEYSDELHPINTINMYFGVSQLGMNIDGVTIRKRVQG